MKIKIKYNHWYPRHIGRRGIVLYPYVLISLSENDAKTRHILHHEWIHVQQVRRYGFLKFYCMYFYEWFINVCRYGNMKKAYSNISYEKEAYAKQDTIKLPESLV
jgi:hypothetical protein